MDIFNHFHKEMLKEIEVLEQLRSKEDVFFVAWLSKAESLGFVFSEQGQEYIRQQVAVAFEQGDEYTIKLELDLEDSFILDEGAEDDLFNMSLDDQDLISAAKKIVQDQMTYLESKRENFINSRSKEIVNHWKTGGAHILEKDKQYLSDFAEKVRETWEKPLSLLEVLISVSIYIGREYIDYLQSQPEKYANFSTEVLNLLNARGLRITQEIFLLLRSGYAEGAMARWRTLHEIGVTSQFIYQGGEETAKRYIDHFAIQSHKAMKKHVEHYKALGWREISLEEQNKAKEEHDKIKQRYGKSFSKDYGWAKHLFDKKGDVTFADIEERVKLNFMRPIYLLGNSEIHASAESLIQPLGLGYENRAQAHVGPSVLGLRDPGAMTAHSLLVLMETLLTYGEATIDKKAYIMAFAELSGDTQLAFHETDNKLVELDLDWDGSVRNREEE